MSLRHVLLGALAEPASGYDLRQSFLGGMQLFWSAELSQIYLELKKMESEGLVQSKSAPSSKGPRKRLYQRTEAGFRVLEDWLLSGPDFAAERNAVIAQTFFLNTIDNKSRQQFFCQLRQSFQTKLAALDAVEKRCCEEDPRFPDRLPVSDLTKYFALTAGQRRMRMMIEWCDECSLRLRALKESDEPAPGGPKRRIGEDGDADTLQRLQR